MLYCNWYIKLLLIEVFQYKYIQETIICYNIDMKQIELYKMMHYDIFNYKKLYYMVQLTLVLHTFGTFFLAILSFQHVWSLYSVMINIGL